MRGDRQTHQQIATLGGQAPEARPFRPQHQRRLRPEFRLRKGLAGLAVEPGAPIAVFLQRFHALRKVGDINERHDLNAAGGSLGQHGGFLRCMIPGADHRTRVKRRCRAQDSAYIMRVRYLIEQQERTFLRYARQKLLQCAFGQGD